MLQAELEEEIRIRRALAKAKPWVAAKDDLTGHYYFLNTLYVDHTAAFSRGGLQLTLCMFLCGTSRTGEAQWHRPRGAHERQEAKKDGLELPPGMRGR